MSCCPEGSLGLAVTEDTKRTLSGVVDGKVYYAPPPAPSSAGVVVIYDVYGFSGGRIKSVCDAIASCGFHVCMPDIYDGTNLGEKGMFENPEAVAWLKGLTVWDVQGPLVAPAFEYLAQKGVTKFGAIGFCWGAYGVCKLAAEGKISAGVSCHPSLVIGKMFFDESEASQVEATKCPLAFLPAGNDPDHYKDGTLAKLVEKAGYERRVLGTIIVAI
ncbi:hypothetical protein CTAYLR_005110 [Chrysophaeum taylorii]|uniref:Dienelactone hydrolase domain-containing protein n=1 Tax=Chrysophaeum taylorii TaxID=2483200 RepID=A0AAD7UG55_9STRA|nr:hypothetical protein CTAYLR_005110 [Chrysophaeum taylorii]